MSFLKGKYKDSYWKLEGTKNVLFFFPLFYAWSNAFTLLCCKWAGSELDFLKPRVYPCSYQNLVDFLQKIFLNLQYALKRNSRDFKWHFQK